MKKILLSLSMIAIVGVLSVGATGAFFSDTETSTGNTFTAGTIDLKIDSEQHYNGNICTLLTPQASTTLLVNGYYWAGESSYPAPGSPCTGTWEQTDLGIEHKFFNFDDIKPGDEGENTISVHIDSNPAWMCVDIAVTKNDDVTCTEPENGAEGVGVCQNSLPSADFDGELAQNIEFFSWLDQGAIAGFQGESDATEGDNIWQATEPKLFSNDAGPLSDAIGGKTYALADGGTPFGPIPPGATQYIGLAWCAGTIDVSVPGVFGCSGASMGNNTQTDSAVANVTFRVEQSRNNEAFRCAPPVVEPVRPTVGALLSTYVAPTGESCNVTVTDEGAEPNTINEGIAAATVGQTVCVLPGTYSEDVVVDKDITLAGAGAASTFIVGQTSGEAGAVVITADGATVSGFDVIDATGGIAGVRISGAHTGITISNNRIQSVSGFNAFLTDGGQSNHTISNNEFVGNSASQLVYVNGNVDVAIPSTNVDFTGNTFSGSATGPLLGISANGSSITLNKFSGTTGYTSLESWEGNNLVNQNNFNVVGQMHVTNGVLGATQFPGTLNADNNWWGDLAPADNVTGLVDFTPSEASALPQN